MKKKLFYIVLICILLFLSLQASAEGGLASSLKGKASKATESSENVPVTVNGDIVEYFQEKGEVVASRNVEIIFKEMKLTCDRIRVNLNSKEAIAEGNVRFTQDGNVFSGEMVSYNFETQKGSILNGRAFAPPWYGKGEKIEKVSEDQYNFGRSYITTCDLEKPHYRLQARRVKIFLGNKIEATHVLIFLGKYPLMYIPYYSHPLKDNRPRVSIIPGRNKDWGAFVLTAWRYYFNDNARGNILLDYREKKGLAEGVDYKYKAGKLGQGYFRAYYIREEDLNKPKDSDRVSNRYRIQYRHRMDIDKDTLAVGEYHKMSDKDFLKDYFNREQYEKDDQPPSYISIIRSRPGYVASLYMQKRINKFFTEVERLPEARLDIKDTQIGESDLYYKGDFVISNLHKKFQYGEGEKLDALRIDTYNKGSYIMKFFKFLNVVPYAATRQTYYSKNVFGDRHLIRGIFEGGVDANVRLLRIYDVKTNFFDLDINHLRHIINPSIGYRYRRPPTISYANLQQFDEIDAFKRENTITLSLENKLQTKRFKKTPGISSKGVKPSETVDLLRAIVSTDYLFKPKETEFGASRFSDFTALLELRPYDWLFMRWDADYSHTILKDTKRISAFKTINFDMTASHEDLWSFSLQHRYERKEASRLNAVATYKLSPKWKIRLLESYDFKKRIFYDRELTLTRDLHCWEMDLTANIRNNSEYTFYAMLRLKAYPAAPLKLSTSYSRATPGPQGTLPK